MVTGLIADADVRGPFRTLIAACHGPVWREIWHELRVGIFTFDDLGLPDHALDAQVWTACQSRGLILVTGNRNSSGPDSLEATIRTRGTASSLPVFTLADPKRILRDRGYAEDVAARMIERLMDIEQSRGSGRTLPAVDLVNR